MDWKGMLRLLAALSAGGEGSVRPGEASKFFLVTASFDDFDVAEGICDQLVEPIIPAWSS